MTIPTPRRKPRAVPTGRTRGFRRGVGTWIALLLAAPMSVPLVWIVVAAIRIGSGGPTVAAFGEVANVVPLARLLLNGLVIAGGQTALAVLGCSLAGFALASYGFRGRRLALALLVIGVALPAPVAIAGLFEVAATLGGVDTYWAATLPGATSALGVLLFAAAFRGVGTSTLEAARLDGCREGRLWWDISMPAVRPTTSAFVLLHFLGAWNAVLWPTAILADEAKRPIAAGLAGAATSAAFEADVSLPLAATLLALLPVAGLFALCGRDLLRRA